MLTTYISLGTEVKNEGAVPPLPLYTFMEWTGSLTLFLPLFKHFCTRKNRLKNYDIRYLHFVSTVERNSLV